MSELVSQGANLMVMGMGTVFVFLTILVIGTTLMSQVIMRLPQAEAETSVGRSASSGNGQEELADIAAVAAVVKRVSGR